MGFKEIDPKWSCFSKKKAETFHRVYWSFLNKTDSVCNSISEKPIFRLRFFQLMNKPWLGLDIGFLTWAFWGWWAKTRKKMVSMVSKTATNVSEPLPTWLPNGHPYDSDYYHTAAAWTEKPRGSFLWPLLPTSDFS